MNKFIKLFYCILLGTFTLLVVMALVGALVEVLTH